MKIIRAGIFIVLLAALLLSVTPVCADTPDPDSTPTLVEVNAYQNVRKSGDWLLVIYANIPYGTIPDLPVTQTFIWSLIDTDNATVFGSTVGCGYNDDGYGYNVSSMYWDSANVTAQGMTWGTVYPLRLAGNPAAFDTPPIYNFTLNAGDYSTLTTQADVQGELGDRVLVIAEDLTNKWGLATGYELVTQNETATVLSIYGESFFRCAIFGIQSMAPFIFSVIIRVINIEDREWDEEYAENVTGQWAGTWVETSRAAGAALFGTDYDLASLILLLGLCAALLIANIQVTGDHWNGLVDVWVWIIIAGRLAFYDIIYLALAVALCWIYVSAKVWLRMLK